MAVRPIKMISVGGTSDKQFDVNGSEIKHTRIGCYSVCRKLSFRMKKKSKKVKRADPKDLRHEDSAAVWNELAYFKSENRNLQVERLVFPFSGFSIVLSQILPLYLGKPLSLFQIPLRQAHQSKRKL